MSWNSNRENLVIDINDVSQHTVLVCGWYMLLDINHTKLVMTLWHNSLGILVLSMTISGIIRSDIDLVLPQVSVSPGSIINITTLLSSRIMQICKIDSLNVSGRLLVGSWRCTVSNSYLEIMSSRDWTGLVATHSYNHMRRPCWLHRTSSSLTIPPLLSQHQHTRCFSLPPDCWHWPAGNTSNKWNIILNTPVCPCPPLLLHPGQCCCWARSLPYWWGGSVSITVQWIHSTDNWLYSDIWSKCQRWGFVWYLASLRMQCSKLQYSRSWLVKCEYFICCLTPRLVLVVWRQYGEDDDAGQQQRNKGRPELLLTQCLHPVKFYSSACSQPGTSPGQWPSFFGHRQN